MYLTLLAFTALLLSSHTGTTHQSCNTLSSFINPNTDSVLTPDYPKSDVCRYREEPHCCTRSVEAVMQGYANTNAHTLFFSPLMRMRDLTSSQYYSLQSLKLPYMSEPLQQTALEFKLLSKWSSRRETLVTQATTDFLDLYYNMEYMPKFCKKSIVENMKDPLNIFLQELVFSHDLVETNWNIAKDLFAVVFSSHFSSPCINQLIRSGLTQISCKTCTDQTMKIPTCFDYCADVVTSCLEPYQPIIELINEWFNLYVRVQQRIQKFIHLDRFLRLKEEMNVLVKKELENELFADVCQYHFKERDRSNDSHYNIVVTERSSDATSAPDSTIRNHGRRKRIAKSTQMPELFSSRHITFPTTIPTSVTPEHPTPAQPGLPFLEGNMLFNKDMICLNTTQTVTKSECWNGDRLGEYNSSLVSVTRPTTTTNTFDVHLPRLKSKMNDLVLSLSKELVIQKIETITNDVEPLETKTTSLAQRPYFNTVTILLIVMTWIKLIV